MIKDCDGVLTVKLLSEDEKKKLLETEAQAEDRVIFGLCKSLNEGVREALNRSFTVAAVIQTSDFAYPHHPYMKVVYGDVVVGEEAYGEERLAELQKSRDNFFLWDNFVLYRSKLPRDPLAKRGMKMVYVARPFQYLHRLSYVADDVFGVPSVEGDSFLKSLLNTASTDPTVGTCLIGFNVRKER